jgi:REP element-mobilizing transposase RayT
MHFDPHHIYHVYNRGNDRVRIFFEPDNYLFLLKKIRNEWLDYCDPLSYCLMPNHFHLMLLAKPLGCENILINNSISNIQRLSQAIGKTLSSYTQAINKKNKTRGTLFQKKTKSKCLTDLPLNITEFPVTDYLKNCFHYIHNNPLEAGIVSKLEQWPYSSWMDYFGGRNGTLCNKEKLVQTLGVQGLELLSADQFLFDAEILQKIW